MEYFKKLRKIKKDLEKIEKIIEKNCVYAEFKCKIFPKFEKIKEDQYFDSILLYRIIKKRYAKIKRKILNDSNCQNCYNQIKNLLQSLMKVLNNLKIIKIYKKIQKTNNFNESYLKFYQSLLFKNLILLESDNKKKENNFV